MREVERNDKWVNDPKKETGNSTGPHLHFEAPAPSDVDLTVVALLMRLYDVQMALLNHFNSDDADRIFDAHQRGEIFNPTIFIPDFSKDSDDSTQ